MCFVTFPCGVLSQVWCLIVSIPDLCLLTYIKCIVVVCVQCLFLTVPWVGLQSAIVEFSGHSHYLLPK